ncbi:hypothetical protein BYT27DRAFT_6563978 [Phlegmacium glaucopus]|nr:hypothetical protein BYT27DRAFT_6563978 [Phlegmacium glaucopus]
MPAPAIYVLAFLGTVGAAIVFKEFVYEPHIAPHIDRWIAEYQAARRRERNAMMDEVALVQRGAVKGSPEEDDHNSDHPDVGLGKGPPTLQAPFQPYMKNGLLIRRRNDHSETTPGKPGHVELDDWITGRSTGTETAHQSDLQSRKNNSFLNESIQSISPAPLSPTTLPSRTPTGIRTGSKNTGQTKTGHKPIELELKKTTSKTAENHVFLGEPIPSIPYTPLSPIRTPTPTHVLYNTPPMHSASGSPFSTEGFLPSPEEGLLPKLETNLTTSHSLQTPSPLQRPADRLSASANKGEWFPRSPQSPPGLGCSTSTMAVSGIAPLLPTNVDSTRTPNNSISPFPPLLSPSLPPALTLSPPLSQLLSLTGSHASPYQTPPHVHAIPSLSQSYPLDDLLDYEHGLELLSPPSPLSRTNSPFEFAGLSPRPEMGQGSALLLGRSGDRRTSGEQLSTPPMDSITNSTRSTTYLSFSSSPVLSTSSVSASSENGYENDSSRSEFSSTFSSPIVAPSRLGLGLDLGPESSPHDQARLSQSMSPLLSRSSPSVDVNYHQHHRRQQQERNVSPTSTRPSVPPSPTPTTRSQPDARRPIVTLDEYDDYADTQTLSPRNRTRSPWTMMNRLATESVVTTSVPTEIPSAARMSRVAMGDSDFDTGSELSDLDFLGTTMEEYETSAPASANNRPARSIGFIPRSRVDTDVGGRSGVVGSVGGIGGPRIKNGNDSDTSSWSLAGGSE